MDNNWIKLKKYGKEKNMNQHQIKNDCKYIVIYY